MKNINELMTRLKNLMPKNIKPAFNTGEELLAWQKEQSEINSLIIKHKNKIIKMRHAYNQSGIRSLYRHCSFKNYKIECHGQLEALRQARQYVEEFDNSISSFIFSGKPGTGKNHLATAICNELLLRNKSVLIITVADIMLSIKSYFNKSNVDNNEERFLYNLSNVDLLVIDEIGIQNESRYEKVIINQIIDRRSSAQKVTGMLTNFNINEMIDLLGERVMDRMKLGNSLYVIFYWDSYRSRITGKQY